MHTSSLQRPEGERRYLHYPARSAQGTIVFLPGTGSTAEWAAHETKLDEMAGFHVVVPEAMRPRPDEPARFVSNPPRWNDGSPSPTPEMATNIDDVAFLNALLDDLTLKDLAPFYLVGFSNGAGMAFRFAAECADRIAALAPIAGLWWPTGMIPSRPVPTYYLLGLVDPLIPFRGGEVNLPWGNRLVRRPAAIATLKAWAEAIGCHPCSRIERDDDGVRIEIYDSEQVEFHATFIEGFGHHWPGGRGQLNRRIAGPIRDTLNLNANLADFFSRYP